MLDLEPNASRFFALEPRRLMHILGWRTPILPLKAEDRSSNPFGGAKFPLLRNKIGHQDSALPAELLVHDGGLLSV
jgi:hypothetical protein